MEKVLKEHKIEVVISVVGGAHISAQFSLVDAIKAVGTVKVMAYFYLSGKKRQWWLVIGEWWCNIDGI